MGISQSSCPKKQETERSQFDTCDSNYSSTNNKQANQNRYLQHRTSGAGKSIQRNPDPEKQMERDGETRRISNKQPSIEKIQSSRFHQYEIKRIEVE